MIYSSHACYCTVKCGNPLDAVLTIEDFIIVMGYNDPSLEGTAVTFSCSPGLVLTGPNTTTCMDNGQWEPDPSEVTCKGEHQIHACINYIESNTCMYCISSLILKTHSKLWSPFTSAIWLSFSLHQYS